MFPTLLKYLESMKAGMRNLSLDIANKKFEEEVEVDEPQPSDGVEEDVSILKKIQFCAYFYFIYRSNSLK